jgi:hypothetical protein
VSNILHVDNHHQQSEDVPEKDVKKAGHQFYRES